MLTFRVTTHTQFGHFGAWALLIKRLDDQVHAGLGKQEAQATQRAGRGPVRNREP
jgi:hypothetical protein